MPLLDDHLRARLPPLHSQEAEEEPMVYARFHLPGTTRAWYLIEGQPEDEDFLFFGFLAGPNEPASERGRLTPPGGFLGWKPRVF